MPTGTVDSTNIFFKFNEAALMRKLFDEFKTKLSCSEGRARLLSHHVFAFFASLQRRVVNESKTFLEKFVEDECPDDEKEILQQIIENAAKLFISKLHKAGEGESSRFIAEVGRIFMSARAEAATTSDERAPFLAGPGVEEKEEEEQDQEQEECCRIM